MPYKDSQKLKEYKHSWKKAHQSKYRVDNLSEEQRLKNNKRMQDRGLPHKRIFTDGGGIWKCALCGATREDNVELHIHHKDQDKKNNSFDNLVCLCEHCHLGIIHSRWSNITIPALIRYGIVDWQGNILVSTDNTENNKTNY